MFQKVTKFLLLLIYSITCLKLPSRISGCAPVCNSYADKTEKRTSGTSDPEDEAEVSGGADKRSFIGRLSLVLQHTYEHISISAAAAASEKHHHKFLCMRHALHISGLLLLIALLTGPL